ncbi:MAG: hypothetical protein KAI99_22050, partial [Cyclobacteriaceae bacterium]|nr:hypothetical protein [Cyclobacteriaceae bacterium]
MAKKNKFDRKKGKIADGLSRRDFFKIGAASATIGAAGAIALPKKAAAKKLDEEVKKKIVNEQSDFPNEIRSNYKPKPSYSTVHGHAFFGKALQAMGVDVDKEALEQGERFVHHVNYEYTKGKKGFDQLSKAVVGGAWSLCSKGAGPMPGAVGDFGMLSWDNNSDKYPL